MKFLVLLLLLSPVIVTEVQAEDATATFTERQLETAQEALFGNLSNRWYRIEVIIFERLHTLPYNAEENLLANEPRQLPYELLELIDSTPLPPSEDPRWAQQIDHCFGFPLFPEQLPPPLTHLQAIGPSASLMQPDETELEQALDPLSIETLGQLPTNAPQLVRVERRSPTDKLLLALAQFERDLVSRSLRSDESRALETEVKLLNRRRHLRPLIHTAWTQAVPTRDAPAPIWISYGDGHERLNGTVDVTVERYLHFAADLWYSGSALDWQPLPVGVPASSEVNAGEIVSLRLHQSRRMRSRELHYLDHPKLGILVQIDPVTIPAELVQTYLELGRPALTKAQ
jgi:hypothetical protein